MKKFKRGLSVFLAVLMLFSALPLSGAAAQDEPEAAYQVGDVIEYGSYPQRQVKSETVIAALDALEKDWKADSSSVGHMQFADVEYNGCRYRAVQMGDVYRTAFQYSCGYYTDNVYYFAYQPLRWTVLDPKKGIVLCTKNVDASTFADSAFHYETDDTSAEIGYSNNYESSYIRNFLNYEFARTAFTAYEWEKMYAVTTSHNGVVYSYHNTIDAVFLPTRQIMTNAAYGFVTGETTMDINRVATETDYAACRGLCCRMPSNLSWNDHSPYYPYLNAYMLSSPFTENTIYFVDCNCRVYAGSNVDCRSTVFGVRPMISLDLSEKLESRQLWINERNVGDEIEFGSYPQTRVTDSALIASLNAVEKDWRDAGQYFGAQICDFDHEGERYRAIQFDEAFYIRHKSPGDGTRFEAGIPYYFRFEPLKWIVMDPDEQLFFCAQAIDCRLFASTDGVAYADSLVRDYLNDEFYHTAFNGSEQTRIAPSEIVSYDPNGDLIPTTDHLFLPSYADVTSNADFYNTHRGATEYAQAQDHKVISGQYTYCYCHFFLRDSSCSKTVWSYAPHGDIHDMYQIPPEIPVYTPSYLCYQTILGNPMYTTQTSQYQGIQPMVRLHNTLNPCEHSYESVVTREPTCTKHGFMTNTCVLCGYSYTEQLAKTPHSLRHYATPKTCLQDGSEYDYCTLCKQIFNTVIDKAEGHTYVDGVCAVCGEEQKWLYNESDGAITITGYTGDDTRVTVPGMIAGKPVAAIGASAFRDNETIEFIKLPDSIRTIGDHAFRNCTALEEVFIGKGAQSIGQNAFAGCGRLATVCILSPNAKLNQSFSGNDRRLQLVVPTFSDTESSVRASNLSCQTFYRGYGNDGLKSLCFLGDVMMYQDLNYYYWKELAEQYRETCYFYFTKITFEGIYREDFDWEIDANIDESEQYLSLESVFIGSRLDGETLSFREFTEYLTMQRSGLQLFFVDQAENEQSITVIVQSFLRLVLNLISRALNRLANAFKKK